MIPYTDFIRLTLGALDCADFDAFVAEEGGSVPLDDLDDLMLVMRRIWDYSRSRDIVSIRKQTGLSQSNFAREFGIPLRTLQGWELGERTAPQYLTDLIAYVALTQEI